MGNYQCLQAFTPLGNRRPFTTLSEVAKQSPTNIIYGTQEDFADSWNVLQRGLLQLHAGLYVMSIAYFVLWETTLPIFQLNAPVVITFALMTTAAFSQNVPKLFSKLKLVLNFFSSLVSRDK